MRHLIRSPILALALSMGASLLAAQPAPVPVRLALVSQWVVTQHRGREVRLAPELRSALDSGVVDRTVFRWQRGLIQRRTLVAKPIRVLAGPEAQALGGQGDFQLAAVRPPSGQAAWTAVEITAQSGRPDDVLILEVGGELNSIAQVLETLFLVTPDGFRELPLARRALVPSAGVPVASLPYGQPVAASARVNFYEAAGVGFFVARSQVEAIVDGGLTASGPADLSSVRDATGDWREGDRIFIRVPAAALRAGVPAVVLGWKDRIFREGGPGFEVLRGRARLPIPIVR